MTNADGGAGDKHDGAARRAHPTAVGNGHALKARAPAKARARPEPREPIVTPVIATVVARPAWQKWIGGALALCLAAALGGGA